ncbi:ArsR/SmtB family transcription factor [Maritalea sp.]|uniref:ArsR/SmtB family transcription factor n=1 Tax=Maritalea sp. TaxID=2003361 RepID=UPI003EF21B5F
MDIEKLEKNADAAAELLGAMANANRLTILCNLVGCEKPVTELVELVGLSQPALSQHLGKLRALKLVKTRREGNVIHYSLTSGEVEAVLNTLYGIYCAPKDQT